MRKISAIAAVFVMGQLVGSLGQTPNQPKVAPGPDEPDWEIVLRDRFGLALFADLKNPVKTTAVETPCTFRKAGPGPVKFTPLIAMGLATRTRGGWYSALLDRTASPKKNRLWSYVFRNTAEDLRTDKNLPPPLEPNSSIEFDPGDAPFGLWISNDGLPDGGVFSEPALVARVNRRLAKQPYKAMIYPNRDKASGKAVAHSYVIGWEYSTNDDFQDVVCQVDNVVFLEGPATP
jgi:hypothetical protein